MKWQEEVIQIASERGHKVDSKNLRCINCGAYFSYIEDYSIVEQARRRSGWQQSRQRFSREKGYNWGWLMSCKDTIIQDIIK